MTKHRVEIDCAIKWHAGGGESAPQEADHIRVAMGGESFSVLHEDRPLFPRELVALAEFSQAIKRLVAALREETRS